MRSAPIGLEQSPAPRVRITRLCPPKDQNLPKEPDVETPPYVERNTAASKGQAAANVLTTPTLPKNRSRTETKPTPTRTICQRSRRSFFALVKRWEYMRA